jgi:hypothetical protein
MIKKAKYTIWGKDLDPAAIMQMDDVMNQQNDLVDIVAKFEPKLVKMSLTGRRKRKRKNR